MDKYMSGSLGEADEDEPSAKRRNKGCGQSEGSSSRGKFVQKFSDAVESATFWAYLDTWW